ncbi:protein translocase subunit SecF [Patescibacteria group bacterium]|nr:protein translocase subunit SecF [Patescibacteria group bacterium]MBU1705638.1 protein translocase subunit SecF [Patescibacteria group bacterium]
MNLRIVENRKYWFALSSVLVVSSLVFLVFWGLKFGIDFTGGSLLEVNFNQAPVISEVRSVLGDQYGHVTVQETGESSILLRLETLDQSAHQAVLSLLAEKFGELEELRFDSIGPVIGQELRRTALIGVIITLLLIGLYIAAAFRKVSGDVPSWKYGVLIIATAFHDVIIAVGAFAVLGHFYNWEVGSAFVAAALTILGYSINDTVVVFDRTRENLKDYVGNNLAETVGISINQTFRRSLNTSVTTLLALAAILIWGGDTTKAFALALMIGIAVGTYSSIFVASPLLVTWEGRKK